MVLLMNCAMRKHNKNFSYKVLTLLLTTVFVINLISFFSFTGASSDLYKDVDIYRNNKNDYMKISLTFDDGPHPRYTPKILEILEEYDIKATFFIVGVNAENYPDTIASIIKKGHEIGNHTYSHPHVSCLDSYNLKCEVEKCESSIYGLTDYKTKLFRPPEGLIDADVRTVLRDLDYKVILWDIDTRDWAHTPPEKIADYVIENVTSGDIILMHDYIAHNSPTPEALRLFIPALLDKGYKFVVISELIGLE